MSDIHPAGPATLPPTPATPTSAPPRRKSPVQIPWREIACRLAEGAKPSAIATDLGLQEERIWRHLRQSLRFRDYLRQAMERQRLLAGLQLAALGQAALVSRGLHPENLDGDLLRLLNEAAHRHEPEADLAQQIEQLGKTGERPPNMAFRRRMAEEKRLMDLQVETWRIQDAARAAAAATVVTAAAAPARGDPARTETKPRDAERRETNSGEPVRSPANASEAPRSAAKAGEPVRSAANASEALRSAANTGEAPRTAANPPGADRPLRLRWSPPPKPRQPRAQALPASPGTVADS